MPTPSRKGLLRPFGPLSLLINVALAVATAIVIESYRNTPFWLTFTGILAVLLLIDWAVLPLIRRGRDRRQ
jgi:hypothetical protein